MLRTVCLQSHIRLLVIAWCENWSYMIQSIFLLLEFQVQFEFERFYYYCVVKEYTKCAVRCFCYD
eukprot:UN15863